MWQRFTEKARRIVFYAQQDAVARGEVYVSTEHLLMGLIHDDDNVAMRILNRFAVTREGVKATLEQWIAPIDASQPKSQDMQLSPRAKRVIDLAYEEARTLNYNYIGTEHLLLGLFAEGEGAAARALASLGLEMEPLREATRELASNDPNAPTTPSTLTRIADVFSGGAPPRTAPPSGERPQAPRWLKFTEGARKAVFFAQEEAGLLGTSFVAPEHALLGLLRDKESGSVRALLSLGLSPDTIHDEMARSMTRGGERQGGEMQLTLASKRLVDLALQEAQEMQSGYIGPEHLLLGLIAEGDSPAAKLLASHGIDLERAREAVRGQ